jgi:hypothetical protein
MPQAASTHPIIHAIAAVAAGVMGLQLLIHGFRFAGGARKVRFCWLTFDAPGEALVVIPPSNFAGL